MFTELENYTKERVQQWNERERVDTSYLVRTKINRDKEEIGVFKVGEMIKNELTWNPIFYILRSDGQYVVKLSLDSQTERILIASLRKAGYESYSSLWVECFIIKMNTLSEIQQLLDTHLFAYDPGYLY